MNQSIPSRWQDCRVAAALRPLSLEPLVVRLRCRVLRAEQLARAAWYFVVGVGR